MSKRKKIIALLTCTVLLMSSTMPVFAAEKSEGVNGEEIQEVIEIVTVETEPVKAENPDQLLIGDYRLKDISKPSASWNISTEGQYDFEYSVYGLKHCYSAYNITGVTESVLFVNSATDDGSTSSYGIEIYKNKTLLDTKISSHTWDTDTDHTKQIRITNMDEDAKYYFKIVPTGEYLSGWGYWKKG